MAVQELDIWARVEFIDLKTGVSQVREIFPNETERGILNLATPSAQQINGILKVITQHSRCNPFAPELLLDSNPVPSNALEWVDGGSIDTEAVELIAHYGSTFPTLQANALPGWKYIVRKQ
ncbi:hypothetical protein NVP1161O_069 [Vibrio phage 1.161.O._10N.261.48.C5]|nr:hypothetical protein NVP1161O_069 [Vibrio phage 1.161.O._10N.261.48.C5]